MKRHRPHGTDQKSRLLNRLRKTSRGGRIRSEHVLRPTLLGIWTANRREGTEFAQLDPHIQHEKMLTGTPKVSEYVLERHLEEERKKRYRERFGRGDIKSLCIDGFLKTEVAQDVYEFLSDGVVFERIYGLYGVDEPVDRDTWERADDADRMYTFSREDGMRDGVSGFRPIKYRRVRDLIGGEAFIEYLEELTGTVLTDLQSLAASAYGVGDYLRPHTDQGGDRKIAYIIYLNPEWREEWGGALHLVDAESNKTEYGFRHNRLVLFDVHDHKHHYIEEISEEAGEQLRYTLGGWVNGSE